MKSSEAGKQNACIRLAVLDSAGKGKPVILELRHDDSAGLKLEVTGDEALGQIVGEAARQAIEDSAQAEVLAKEQAATYQDAIRQKLIAAGFAVKELPSADVSFAFEFDLRTGLGIGKHQPLHEFANSNPELSRRIGQSLRSAFNRGFDALVQNLQTRLDQEDHPGAAEALRTAKDELPFAGRPTLALLGALRAIDPGRLDRGDAYDFHRLRAALAYGGGDLATVRQDAEALLRGWPDMPLEERNTLRNTLGVAAIKEGRVETAIRIWRDVLKDPASVMAGERGWVWRNLSMALDREDPEAARAAQLSADAFLENGNRAEAARSLGQLARILEHSDPREAIRQLDNVLSFARDTGLLERELKATVHHAKANRLIRVGALERALGDALAAAALRRGVVGLESELISSLHLAANAAEGLGKNEQTTDLRQEAMRLAEDVGDARFAFARRIREVMKRYDAVEAQRLLADAKDHGDAEIVALVATAIAVTDPDLGGSARLERLEGALLDLDRAGGPEGAQAPIFLAIASQLRDQGEFKRAGAQLRRLLEITPHENQARDMLVDVLWKAGDWAGAASFLKAQLAARGEMPGMLVACGRSLLESGDVNGALDAFTRALKLPDLSQGLREQIRTLREQALDRGGSPGPSQPPVDPSDPVTRAELEGALRDFAGFVAADKRMEFWSRGKRKEHQWVSRPERFAQNLLHVALKLRFGLRIAVYEEIGTGAGRLDLLLQLEGGLSAIIEVKMCGAGYSTSYAASGEPQIRHYMENRGVHLGYLVVFDARADLFGTPLFDTATLGGNTVIEVPVDVRPRPPTRRQRGV